MGKSKSWYIIYINNMCNAYRFHTCISNIIIFDYIYNNTVLFILLYVKKRIWLCIKYTYIICVMHTDHNTCIFQYNHILII